jgi:hypothetical protein
VDASNVISTERRKMRRLATKRVGGICKNNERILVALAGQTDRYRSRRVIRVRIENRFAKSDGPGHERSVEKSRCGVRDSSQNPQRVRNCD